MQNVRELLEAERETERDFVTGAATEPPHPTGWTPALLMFHLATWRERLGDALRQVSRGQTYAPPPDNIDEVNDRELAANAATSLEDAAKRSDVALAGLITVWDAMGDRPFEWYMARTTGEALIRNSYHHPRVHLAEHFTERADTARGPRLARLVPLRQGRGCRPRSARRLRPALRRGRESGRHAVSLGNRRRLRDRGTGPRLGH